MLVHDANHGRGHRLLGHTLLERGDTQRGLAHLEVAAQLMPADPAVRAELAAAREALGVRETP